MRLHQAEWLAGEAIAFYLAGLALTWAAIRHRKHKNDSE